MTITVTKLIAAGIAVGYFATAVVVEKPGISEVVMLCLVLLVPVALIWYPQMGSSWPRKKTVLYTYEDTLGRRRRRWRDSHPGMVAFMGWVFLLALPIIFYFMRR